MGRGTLAKLVKAAASVQQPKAAKDKKRNNAEHPSIVEKQAKKYKSGHARSTNSMSAGMAKHAPPVVSVEVDVPSVQDSAGAYQALVSMLSSGMGSSSAALRRRQHEAAQGDSDGSEDEVDLEGGGSQDDEDEAGSSELDEDEVEGCSEDALEQDVDGDSEMADEAEEGGEGKEVHDSDGGDSEADEQPTPAPNAAGSNDNEETTPMAPTQSGAGHSAAPEDTWARHVEHLLPNEQVAELEGGSRRTKFTESESPSLQVRVWVGDRSVQVMPSYILHACLAILCLSHQTAASSFLMGCAHHLTTHAHLCTHATAGHLPRCHMAGMRRGRHCGCTPLPV